MNFLVSEVRRLSLQSVREVLNANTGELFPLRERTVLITVNPSESDTSLSVRQVRYDVNPPQQCEGEGETLVCHYTLDDIEFAAFPDFGLKAIDYADDTFDVASDVLDDTAPFLRAYHEDGTWRLQKPPSQSGLKWGILRGVAGGKLRVQPVKLLSDGRFANDGPLRDDILPPPTASTADFQQLISTAAYVPLLFIDGAWFALQVFIWNMPSVPRDLPRTDCMES